MARIIKDDNESFVAMVERMQAEGDHGSMTKEDWDNLKAKYFDLMQDMKRTGAMYLMPWKDVEDMYK